jgi:hypothetical protein
MKRQLFIFGLLYKDIAKPLFLTSVILNVYVEGSVNGIDDYYTREKKSFTSNIMKMGKGMVKGAIIGVTFPISVPLILLYYQQFK